MFIVVRHATPKSILNVSSVKIKPTPTQNCRNAWTDTLKWTPLNAAELQNSNINNSARCSLDYNKIS